MNKKRQEKARRSMLWFWTSGSERNRASRKAKEVSKSKDIASPEKVEVFQTEQQHHYRNQPQNCEAFF
nr:hypothetical protein CFP56_41107 [Quercus suber]